MHHVCGLWSSLSTMASLSGAAFAVERGDAQRADIAEDISEDDFADTFGQLITSLATLRLRRNYWLLRGWPWSMPAAVEQEDLEPCLERFQEDLGLFRIVQNAPSKGHALHALEKRHMLNKVSCKQLEAALADRGADGWEADFVAMLKSHLRVAAPTQVIEDMMGVAKNSKVVRTSSRYRRLEHSMAAILRQGVVHRRHRFAAIEPDTPVGPKPARLPIQAFQGKIAERSLPWQTVVSTSSATTWYSPNAENYSANAADMVLLQEARRAGDLDAVSEAWLGCVAQVSHKLLLGIPQGNGQFRYYHLLHHFDKSGVLGWPDDVVSVPGTGQQVFVHSLSEKSPTVLALLSFEGVRAMTFKWWSWLHQVHAWGRKVSDLPVRIAAVIDNGPAGGLEVAAKHAFWAMSRTSIVRLGGLKGVVVPGSATMCEALMLVVQACLPGASQDDVLRALAQRLCINEVSASFADAFLGIEEAHQVLDRDDAEKLVSEQQHCRKVLAGDQEFVGEFAKARSSAGPAKRKRKAAVKLPPRLPSTIPQSEAKLYIPENCSVWRGVSRCEWCGHCPPFRRVSSSWLLHGEHGALVDLARRLWRQHLNLAGKPLSDCPFAGLFEDAAVVAVRAEPSSSSQAAAGPSVAPVAHIFL